MYICKVKNIVCVQNRFCDYVYLFLTMRKVEFVSYLDAVGLNRIRVRLLTEKGDLHDVMFQYETLIAGEKK